MAQRISERTKTRPFGVGVFVAGVIAVLYYNATDSFNWWMLGICIVVSFVVDHLVYGTSRVKGVYIEPPK